MEKKLKFIIMVCMTALILVVLAACSKSGGNQPPAAADPSNTPKAAEPSNTPKAAEPTAESTEPFKITMMLSLGGDMPPNDNVVEKAMEEYTNTDINIQWVPGTSYNDKVNVTIASGEMPMVIASPGGTSSSIQNAMRNGVFWELGPFITEQDFPQLAAISPIVYGNLSLDGKIYGLPQVRPLSRDTINYRKDWLDNLKMEQPKTLEDLYKVIVAFTNDDPDGNSKKDTLGVSDDNSLEFFKRIAEATGIPNKWMVDNGKFVPEFMTPGYLEAMRFYKRLYDEKLINADFAATTGSQSQNNFFNGKSGMYSAVAGAASSAQIQFDKSGSGGVAGVIPRLQTADGKTIKFSESGYNRLILIPKSSVKTEAEVKKILTFFERLGDPDMLMLLRYGVEGVHYKLENGKPVDQDEAEYKRLVNIIQSSLKVIDFTDEVNQFLPPLDAQAQRIFKENGQYAIANPAMGLISQTFTEQGSELETIILDARTKFIMGELDEQGWNKQIDTWLKRGGQKIIDEYTAAYSAK